MTEEKFSKASEIRQRIKHNEEHKEVLLQFIESGRPFVVAVNLGSVVHLDTDLVSHADILEPYFNAIDKEISRLEAEFAKI